MRITPLVLAGSLWLAVTAIPSPSDAAGLELDPKRSVLAVLTHKSGIAKGMAHDHLVTAPLDALQLTFDAANPEATRASLVVPVERLEIDHFAARAQWKARLLELGAGPKELAPVAESDRAKVREAMLDDDQLDAAKFPELRAELLALRRTEKPAGAFDGLAKLRLTIHGKSVEREIPARWSVDGSKVESEALGEFRFTEFGIEPYSGPLGAVKNEDRFHVYVKLVTAH